MMTKEQIITGIIDCLDHQLHSGMGHMQDKYYRGEFFHFFTEAYNHGFIVGRPKTAKQAQFSCPECGPRHHIPVPVSVPIRFRGA